MNEEQEEKLCDLLLPYLQKALVDNPQNYINHAADYFTRLRDEQDHAEEIEEGSKEQIEKTLGSRSYKRVSIAGESFNPEEAPEDEDDAVIVPKTDEERNRIVSRCKEIFIFRTLDKKDLYAVIDVMERRPVEEGEVIIKQGDDGDYFYLIDKGKFNAYIEDPQGNEVLVMEYEDDGFFGELALLHNQPRAATVKAASEGFLWAVCRQTFNRLIVRRAFQKRKMYMELLDGVPALRPLSEYEKMQVTDALFGKFYSTDEVIVKEGDEGDGMYFIVEGKVSVRQKRETDNGEEDVEIAQLGEGEYFGGKIYIRSWNLQYEKKVKL